jgi:glutathione S-transferase
MLVTHRTYHKYALDASIVASQPGGHPRKVTDMELYFSPLACSLASRIALYEAGLETIFIEVDPQTKRLPDGSDYRALHPLGLVPALRTDGGLLTENAAVLQYIAERAGDAGAPARAELHRWLSFIGTELHKGIFATLFDPTAPEEAKHFAMEKGRSRLAYIDRHMQDRTFVLDEPTVADAFLYTVLNWTLTTPIELDHYPALKAFHQRMKKRPSVARAFAEELALYQARAQARG